MCYPMRHPMCHVVTRWVVHCATQALETYQCKDPTSRATCPTNPTTDVAGLMAVLPRLIALPDGAGVSAPQRAAWRAMLDGLPPLPITLR